MIWLQGVGESPSRAPVAPIAPGLKYPPSVEFLKD